MLPPAGRCQVTPAVAVSGSSCCRRVGSNAEPLRSAALDPRQDRPRCLWSRNQFAPVRNVNSVVLPRRNFRVVYQRLEGHRGSSRGELANDEVDRAAPIADHEGVLDEPDRCSQIDVLKASTVRIDPVGTRLPRSEFHQIHRPKAITRVIGLCIPTFAVERAEADYNPWSSWRSDIEN